MKLKLRYVRDTGSQILYPLLKQAVVRSGFWAVVAIALGVCIALWAASAPLFIPFLVVGFLFIQKIYTNTEEWLVESLYKLEQQLYSMEKDPVQHTPESFEVVKKEIEIGNMLLREYCAKGKLLVKEEVLN